ncbi:Histone deacetylase hda1, partial [Podila humilis]
MDHPCSTHPGQHLESDSENFGPYRAASETSALITIPQAVRHDEAVNASARGNVDMATMDSGVTIVHTDHEPIQTEVGSEDTLMVGVAHDVSSSREEKLNDGNNAGMHESSTDYVKEDQVAISDSTPATTSTSETIITKTMSVATPNGVMDRDDLNATPSASSSTNSPSSSTATQIGHLQPQPDFINGRSTRTGYVYDVRMSNVHGEDDHPEDPRRIWRIYEALQTARCTDRMIKIPSREATVEELHLVHTDKHVSNVTKTASMSMEELLDMANNYNSIYLNNSSAFCARLSCGSLLELCKAVATGEVLNGVAIVRPPGHHAEPDEAGGFCLYNNVAIAARYLQKNFGLRKIFILDWDVHHGNGTQKAFIDDPDVVYCSIHRYENGTFYPGDPVAAAHTTVGDGPGRGRNINIPWPTSGMGDAEYIYTFHKVILPIIYEFAPDFILVSAGFDAAKGDHIGENLVTPAAYGHMTHMLKNMAGGKIILALEGGYNLDSIAVSGLACTKALLNDPIDALEPLVPNATCVQTIHEVMEVQSKYWKSLTPMYIDPMENAAAHNHVVELSKVLSVYRTEFLYERHDMIKLPISNTSHGEDFLSNVHTTQDLYSTEPLYIFVHNLGEFCARTVGISNVIRPEKSVLVDSVAQYVDKIVKSGNQLIDIVVPYHPATEEEKTPLKEKITALLADIWDNFVFMSGKTRRIILLASGFGCHGLVSFMNERQKDVSRYVSCVVLIPGGEEPLPMVVKRLGHWYMENSFVVVADNHPIWERTNQKANSRVGNLVRSGRPVERLSDSLLHLFKTTFEEINKRLATLPPLEVPMELGEDLSQAQSLSSSSTTKLERSNGAGGTPESKPSEERPRMTTPTTVVHPPAPPQSLPPGQTNTSHPSAHSTSTRSQHSGQSGQQGQGQQPLTSRGGSTHSSAPHSPVSAHGGPSFQQSHQQQQHTLQRDQQQRTPVANYSLVDRPGVTSHKHQRSQPYPSQNGAAGSNMSRGAPASGPARGRSSPGLHPMTGRPSEPFPHGYESRPAAAQAAESNKHPPSSQQSPHSQHSGYQAAAHAHHPQSSQHQQPHQPQHHQPQYHAQHQQQYHSQHHPYGYPAAESSRSEGYLPQGSKHASHAVSQ